MNSEAKTYLVLFQAVLENVLDDQTASLAKRNLMPHAAECLVDILHDLWWRLRPAQLKKFLPDVASIAVNDCLRNAAKQLMNHDRLVVLWHRVESLLHDVTAERIHGEIESVTTDSLSDLNHLLWSAVLEATLDEKVTKAVDHQWVSLSHNGLDDVVLLLCGAHLELLLKEDRGLLVVVAHDLVNDILPVAVHSAVQEATIIQWLGRWEESLAFYSDGLWSSQH